VEEQDVAAEAVHDAGATARPHDVRREVSRRDLRPRQTRMTKVSPDHVTFLLFVICSKVEKEIFVTKQEGHGVLEGASVWPHEKT
jgi:hypothetical protein